MYKSEAAVSDRRLEYLHFPHAAGRGEGALREGKIGTL